MSGTIYRRRCERCNVYHHDDESVEFSRKPAFDKKLPRKMGELYRKRY